MFYDRERALINAWDFLEHWQQRLSQQDGEQRLEEFYSALLKFIKRENVAERYLP
jgi:hypothetical protein